MKTKLTLLILFCSTGLYSQNSIDYQKLAKACELWGLIKYFHPDTPGHEFDSAFAANVPGMLEAKHEDEWRDVLTQWLRILKDSNTEVISDDPAKRNEGLYRSEFTNDSTLVVRISGTKLFEDIYETYYFFQKIKEQLARSKKNIVFDLRQNASTPRQYQGYLSSAFGAINGVLATEVVPQYKRKYYSGFKPETGSSNSGYTINTILKDAVQPGIFHQRNQKVAWVVNEYSDLPVVALSQQASGAAIILSTFENITDLMPLSNVFEISENLKVKFKDSDLVLHNGPPIADYVYSESENPIEISRKLLSTGSGRRSAKPANSASRRSDGGISYPQEVYPTVGYRILAAAKIFTVIETFFPYYELMDKNWRTVFVESLGDFIEAKDEIEYQLAVAKLYCHINDSHGYIAGNKALDQLRGEAPSPVVVDWIENKIVVTQFRNDSICQAKGIAIGDVILKVNGVSVDELLKKYDAYLAHSTNVLFQQRAAQYCIKGPENRNAVFTVQDKNGKLRDIRMTWSKSYDDNFAIKYKLDTIAFLNDEIGYADLTRMEVRQTDEMFEKFRSTKAIVFDMRGYPRGTAWSIAPRLTDEVRVPLALIRKSEILSVNSQKGEALSHKSYTEFVQTLAPSDKWKYKGKTVMLIDENAGSQSEHSGLFFEAVNNTTFIGSPTVGANGDVTRFQIPGGMVLTFSGLDIRHADNRQLQRIGLQPHVVVRPTIEGIRKGKDEVLAAAIKWIDTNVK